MQLELNVRCVDLNEIILVEKLKTAVNDSKKGILVLFNEYKIVLEAALLENSIPFYVNI